MSAERQKYTLRTFTATEQEVIDPREILRRRIEITDTQTEITRTTPLYSFFPGFTGEPEGVFVASANDRIERIPQATAIRASVARETHEEDVTSEPRKILDEDESDIRGLIKRLKKIRRWAYAHYH